MLQQGIQKLAVAVADFLGLAAAEAAACNDDGVLVPGQFRDLGLEHGVGRLLADLEFHGRHVGTLPAQLFQIVVHHAAAAPLGGEGLGFDQEIVPLAGDDGIFCSLHLHEFAVGDLQEIGQGQLFVDAVGAVEAVAVGTHDAGNAAAQVAFQGVGPQVDDVIQAHVAGELEFQNHVVVLDLLQQFLALGALEAGAVQAVADAHIGEGLPGQKGFLHQTDGLGHVALQRVVFTGVDTDGPVGVLAGDAGDDFPDDGLQFRDIVDFLAHEVTAHHIGVFADHLQSLNGFRQVVAGNDVVLHQS